MTFRVYYSQLVAGQRTALKDRLFLFLLGLVSRLYSLAMQMRGYAYKSGFFPVLSLPVPVISVGNLTLGGTGKTPVVLMIARHLMSSGKKVAVISRGYGGTLEGSVRLVSDGSRLLLTPAEAGDEPFLLASSLPGLIVVIGSDRYAAGCYLIDEISPDCILLDDGFQHMRLARDLNILLLDGKSPFGNRSIFPAGHLREPISAADRASLVIFTRCDSEPPAAGILPPKLPYITSRHELTGFTPLAGGDIKPFSTLSGKRIIAFCGIAGPESFFEGLEASGVKLLSTITFPDHTDYGQDEMTALGRLKVQYRADCLITTAKDAVKLQKYSGILGDCCVARLDIVLDDEKSLYSMVEDIFKGEHNDS